MLRDYDISSMPVLKEILDTLDGEKWKIRSGELIDNEFFLITAEKKYKSKQFITLTECYLDEDIVYVQTKCLWTIPDEKYIDALELANKESLRHPRTSCSVTPDEHKFIYFDSVPYESRLDLEMPQEAYLCCIWYGVRSCCDLVDAIEESCNKKGINLLLNIYKVLADGFSNIRNFRKVDL